MNTHRITAMAMAVALTGFTYTLAAEENISATTANENFQQDTAEQKPEMENVVSEMDTPIQTFAPPTDKLLSELKVYPSF